MDVDDYFMITQMGHYEHTIEYEAPKDQELLRVVIARSNAHIKMFEGQKLGKHLVVNNISLQINEKSRG